MEHAKQVRHGTINRLDLPKPLVPPETGMDIRKDNRPCENNTETVPEIGEKPIMDKEIDLVIEDGVPWSEEAVPLPENVAHLID